MDFATAWQQHDACPPASARSAASAGRAFEAARRHSRLVRVLRVVLPLAGASSSLRPSSSPPALSRCRRDLDLSVARLSVTRNSIIMDNPHLTGFDADKREYRSSADRAIQALARPRTRAAGGDRGGGRGAGARHCHDRRRGRRLRQSRRARSTLLGRHRASIPREGYALRMSDADIDLGAGTHGLRTIRSPSATRTARRRASRSAVSEGGKLIVLEGGVRTTPDAAQARAGARLRRARRQESIA